MIYKGASTFAIYPNVGFLTRDKKFMIIFYYTQKNTLLSQRRDSKLIIHMVVIPQGFSNIPKHISHVRMIAFFSGSIGFLSLIYCLKGHLRLVINRNLFVVK